MENIGISSDILAGEKKFYIQTQYLEPAKKIMANVFENGKVINSKTLLVNDSIKSQELKNLVAKVHKDISDDMEILFYISDKVRTIQHAASNNKLGLIFLKRNLFDEAINEFNRALQIDHNFAECYNNLGVAYLKKNMLKQAQQTFVRGIEKKDNYADLHNNLGVTFFLLNDLHSALRELHIALELNQNFAYSFLNLCLVNIKSIINDIQDSTFPPRIDRINETKELLSRVLKDFDIFNKQYINAALDYIEANNFQEAFKALQNADADKKDANEFENLENEFYLNFMFGGKGKDDEFIQEYTNKLCSAIEKKPNFADLRNDLGIAYLIQCRNLFLKGLSEFRAALSINPEYERAKKNLKLAENDGKGFLILLRAILK